MFIFYSYYIYIYIYIYNSHHVMLLAWISLTPSHHSSLLSITSGRSSRLRSFLVDHPTFVRPCEGVHWKSLIMTSSLLLQLCPACFVNLIWIILDIGGRWPYSCCFVRSFFYSILVQFLSRFFSICLVSVHVIHPYNRIDATTAWKKLHFILLDKLDFHMIDSNPCLH